MATNAQLQSFEALFRVFDKDNSGSIEEADFLAVFEPLKAKATVLKAEKINLTARRWFLSIYVGNDTNKDRKISKQEWLDWMTDAAASEEETIKTDTLSSKFSRLTNAIFDTFAYDNDTISAEEYATWFGVLGLSGDPAAIFSKFYLMQNGTLGHGAFDLLLKEFVLGDASKPGSRFFGELV
jgi:EF-hand domain pair